MTNDPIDRRIRRCAIYTRKSTEHGLDMAVSSLEAQRDVCQAYIKSQGHRNWVELPRRYDDGGYSGGSLERPALRRLVADIEAGRIDIVVIYKIDRLTRSLLDFVRLIDVLEKYGASFVSVTQAFDTSDSMGRLVLNVLLTFAQFERELMSDRVRDKKAAMRKKGLFAGGLPPFGYLVEPGGKLVVDTERAEIVRQLYDRYPQVSSVRQLVEHLRRRGCVTRRWEAKSGKIRGGSPITAAIIRQILQNPIYTGFIVHRGQWIQAQVQPLVSRAQWELAQQTRISRQVTRDPDRNFLLGILYDEHGRRMRMSRTAPGYGCKERYYKAQARGLSRLPGEPAVFAVADDVEQVAISALKAFLIDRTELKNAVLSLGLYSDEIARLLKRGLMASRRIALLDQAGRRRLFLAVVPRAEVTRSELRLYVSCRELGRLLAWDGIGLFTKSARPDGQDCDRVHVISAKAQIICGKRQLTLPIYPCEQAGSRPKPWLVELLKQASELRELVLANRTKSVRDLAKQKRIGASQFARLLRLNYLAPDIQTAIIDGTQPDGLTQYDLLCRPIPVDWEQQRQLLGFS